MRSNNLLFLPFVFCLLLQTIRVFALVLDDGVLINNSNYSCQNGLLLNKNTINNNNNNQYYCHCYPCWQGINCDTYVDTYSPRFLVHMATAVSPVNVTGPVYRAWSSDEDLGLTCPLGPGQSSRCPCAAVRYELFSPPGDHHFVLNPETGILSRASPPPAPLNQGQTYSYKLMVQSTPLIGISKDVLYDILDLKVFIGSPFTRKIPWT